MCFPFHFHSLWNKSIFPSLTLVVAWRMFYTSSRSFVLSRRFEPILAFKVSDWFIRKTEEAKRLSQKTSENCREVFSPNTQFTSDPQSPDDIAKVEKHHWPSRYRRIFLFIRRNWISSLARHCQISWLMSARWILKCNFLFNKRECIIHRRVSDDSRERKWGARVAFATVRVTASRPNILLSPRFVARSWRCF